jgi:DNA polymerase-3 subunit beta
MKVICQRDTLLSAAQIASAGIPSKEIKPILNNFKLTATTSASHLTSTDLEIGVRIELAGIEVYQAGDAILPADKLLSILRESRDPRLQLEATATSCLIQGDALEFELPGEDPALFPELPTLEGDNCHEVKSEVIRDMIRRTIFAVSEEGSRYSMTGVLWELEEDQVRLVATDGRRLAVAEGAATLHGDHNTRGQTCVVPTKAMALLERTLATGEDAVKVAFRQNDVFFRTARALIYSRLVEGRFPDYRQVIPKKSTIQVELPIELFHSAVRQAAIMTDDESRRVAFQFAKDKLTLQAQGPMSGRSKVEVPLVYKDKPLDINFNPAYLTDMLKTLSTDAELHLEMTSSTSPALFRSGPNYTYLVMPLT